MVVIKERTKKISRLLVENKSKLLSIFLDGSNMSLCNQLNREITIITYDFYELVIKYIETRDTSKLGDFSLRLAELNLNNNIGIIQAMEHINYSRKIFTEAILQAELEDTLKIEALTELNDFYALVTQQMCTHYTNLKNREIEKQSQFIQSMHMDRLTILGKLATSFAHEFRNPLTSIKGFVQLLEYRFSNQKDIKGYFHTINHELDSLQSHVNQFLLLSQKENHEDFYRTEIHLDSLIYEVLDFLYPTFTDKNIDVQADLQEQIVTVGMRSQIKQVIINIINNAIDALVNRETGRRIKVRVCDAEEDIKIIFENNGPMIPHHLVENIFEPFITTKELGTGLGLSVCKQIIEKHHGELSCISQKDKTEFILILKRK